jgi:ankyrin repeat protein
MKNKYGWTPLHWAAWHGALDKIPRELLTTENLTIEDREVRTPLHFAALNGHLNQIPRELLTQENLTIKNGDGGTPLHFAALNGTLDQIPKELLTQENLTIKDGDGETPLFRAAEYQNLPAAKLAKLLTKETTKALLQTEQNPQIIEALKKTLELQNIIETSRQKLSDTIAGIPQIR